MAPKFSLGFVALALGLAATGGCSTEQRVDNDVDISVAAPFFAGKPAPSVAIDSAHGNYHVAAGRYAPFARLLGNDGMKVADRSGAFTDSSLAGIDILVIANASGPDSGSAFTVAEIGAVERFVAGGGSLLLVTDHIPYPAAAADLAAVFGVTLSNTFAEDDGSGLFTRANGGLTDDPLLHGVTQIRTFGGSAFRLTAPAARPLLRLGDDWTIQTMAGTGLSEKSSAAGTLQGAVLEHGKGRVAVFAEAGMFTAQTSEGLFGDEMGFHAEGAEQNKLLILRVMHWLAKA